MKILKWQDHLQNKFDNVDTIAQDSCFHFGYMVKAEERDDNDNFKMVDKRHMTPF